MKKYQNFLVIFLAMLALVSTSCSDSNDDAPTITEQTINNCFAYVSDIANGPSAYYGNVGYKVRLNYTAPSADVTVSGLKLTDGTTYPTFSITGLKFGIDSDGWIVLTGENIRPDMPGVAEPLLFSRFSVRLYQRMVGDMYFPAFCVSMSIGGRYSIVSSLPSQVCFGNTKSVADPSSSYTTSATQYGINFNIETRCVTLSMGAVKFTSGMEAMDFVLENIPFKIIDGKAVFEIDNIIPKSNGVPYTAFPITGLKSKLDFGGDFEMEYDCAPRTFEGTTFHVSADCDFSPGEANI